MTNPRIPVQPTMTGIHECALEITIRNMEDEGEGEYTGGLREIFSVVRSLSDKETVLVPRKEIEGWLGDLLAVNAATVRDANALDALYSNIKYWLRAASPEPGQEKK